MFSRTKTRHSTAPSWDQIEALRQILDQAQAVVIGAGAGLSASAGFEYTGTRFQQYFGDFATQFGFQDMYTGGFYPFPTPEEYWAYWSRFICINRYMDPPKPVYSQLLRLVSGKDFFVLTTNVDHQFQRAGFDKKRLFYTQGDYGLWQCAQPCHARTYDNEASVREMWAEQRAMRIPSSLLPRCPVCGKPMTMNLRTDDTFVQDEGWYQAAARYQAFLRRHRGLRVVFWELGVGQNTPGIIKYPFWQRTMENPNAVYVCVNAGESFCPEELKRQSLCIDGDIGTVLTQVSRSAMVPSARP